MSNPPKNKMLVFIIVVLLLANVAMLVYFVWLKQPEKPVRAAAGTTDRFGMSVLPKPRLRSINN